MHPLTILAVGLYGKTLMNQNGAPIRLVVPWKYGFKSIKSIVRIRFVDRMPRTAWSIANARRVRLLLEREPRGRSSALEAGARAPHPRALRRATDADVQRLRRSGRVDVRRHGPAEVLLISGPALRKARRLRRCAGAVRVAACFARLTGRLGVNPVEDIPLTTGIWTLRFLLITLAITPLRRLTGWNASFSTGGCSGCSPSSTRPCTC